MKKIKLVSIILLFKSIICLSQNITLINIDSSIVNHKVDFCGYNASKLANPNARIANNGLLSPSAMSKSLYPANAIFNCGAFRLYYEDIALGTGDGFNDAIDGPDRRATLCAIYQYIQNTFDLTNIPITDPITIEIQRSFTTLNPPTNPGVLATAGPVYPNISAPGIYNGSLLNHVLTNSSPDVNLFDAVLQVNFAAILNSSTISYHNSATLPVPNCEFDLYTILLHEVGHQLGFGSLLREDVASKPSSFYGNNQYTLFDWQNIWHGNINNTSTFEKIVTGTISNPEINTAIINSTNYLRDEGLWLKNQGRFLGNLPIYSGAFSGFYNSTSITIGSVASHICGDNLSFSERFSLSPGYMKPFSMAPFIASGETRREYTDEEIRIFIDLGYTLNPAFAASTSINGIDANSIIIQTNRAPVTTKQVTSPTSGTSSFESFPDLVQNVDFPITNNGVPLIIQLASDLSISDADGDLVRIENNTLFNIRGCSNNGNNHNCLSVNAAGTIITYTPRPNFIGRAQFGFYLHDGKERGSFMVYTIDVTTGSSFVNTPNVNTPVGNNELVINGDFEEVSEIRKVGSVFDENLINATIQLSREEGLFFSGAKFSDAHPLQYANWFWSAGSGVIINNSAKACSLGVTPITFGNRAHTVPSGAPWNNPTSITGNSYSYILGNHNYHTLATPLITCKRYITTFDVNFSNTGLAVGSTYIFNIRVHSAIAYPTNPSLQTIPVSIVVGTGWQTITVPFIYCNTTNGNYLNFVGNGKINYDNVSLIEDLSPPPPLVVNASANSSQICIGNNSTLTGIATNNFCNTTYVWQPGNLNGASVSVSPNATTSYVLTVNDGCRTNTASVTVNVVSNPVSSIITNPACSNGVCDGSANITSTGGLAPYTYVWNESPVQIGSTSSELCIGAHQVTTTDANGCSASSSYNINVNTLNYDYPNGINITSSSQVIADQFPYDGKIMIKGPVYINVNYTLTNKTWYFGNDFTLDPTHDLGIPASGVVVMPGFILTMDNTIFTAAEGCSMWAGVQVWGRPAAKKTVAAIGKLVMKNVSIIQYAHTGVSCFRSTPVFRQPVENGMGLLQAYGQSKFINNGTGVAFSGRTLIDNFSYINDCEFICNAPLPDATYAGVGTESFIRLNSIKSPNFRGNLFTNTYSSFSEDKRGTGINSYNAGYNVTPFGVIGNTFNNLTNGIYTYATGGIKNINISSNTFNNVQEAITTTGTNYDNIIGNTFNIPDETLSTVKTWGIYLNGTSGFNVSSGNTFNKCASCTGLNSKGIIVLDAGTFAGTVSKNNFNNLQIASQSEGNNGNATGGLQLKCNTYTGNQYAISVSPQIAMHPIAFLAPQGVGCFVTSDRPANNFIGGCNSDKDIASTINFDYIENPNNLNPANCVSSSIIGYLDCPSLSQPDNCNGSGDGTNPNSLQGLQNQMDNQPNILQKKQLLHELIIGHLLNSNGNNTEVVIKNLLEAWNTDETRKILVPMYIDMGEYTKAQNTLAQIPQGSTEDMNYHQLYDVLISLGQASKTINEMSLTQEQTIRGVSNSSTLIKYHAQAVLEGANKEHFIRTPEEIQLSSARLAFLNNENEDKTTIKQNINEPLLMANYPNPFNENTVIPYYLPDETITGVLTITDIMGRIIVRLNLNKGLNNIDFKTSELNNGIYYCTMIVDDKIITTKKMTLIK